LWKLTEITRKAAERWVSELSANLGGTEMEAALDSTFALAKTVPCDVLLVTDGEISAIDSTIETARQSGHRLFIVGIGSSPAETHLRRLAEASGGACDFVAPGEAVEPAVLRMFARLRSPRLSELALAWPEGMVPQWVSPLPRSVSMVTRAMSLPGSDRPQKENCGCWAASRKAAPCRKSAWSR
jgi:hypothetical protein